MQSLCRLLFFLFLLNAGAAGATLATADQPMGHPMLIAARNSAVRGYEIVGFGMQYVGMAFLTIALGGVSYFTWRWSAADRTRRR